MSFAWPFMLLSLALIPLVVLAYLLVQRRRVKYAMRFTNLDLLANVVDRSPGWRQHLPPVFALAARSPRCSSRSRGRTTIAVPRDEASVVLAIDVSGSMMATDVPPTARGGEGCGLPVRGRGCPTGSASASSFSTGATALAEPTDDRTEILDQIDGLGAHRDRDRRRDRICHRPCAEGRGRQGGDRQGRQGARLDPPARTARVPRGISTDDAIGLAKDAGIAVSTIALGTDAGTVTVPNELGEPQTVVAPDRETLEQIADETGGTAASTRRPSKT